MPSLPPPLQNRLRNALLRCASFGSNDALRTVFSDARIVAWKHNVPEASTPASRVSFLVSQFMDAWNAEGQNGLSLFLCALSEAPERGMECPTEELCALSTEIHTALVAGKIVECERELAQVKEHQARGWSDPTYSQHRAAELQAQIQTWQGRQETPPLCVPVIAAASGADAKPSEGVPEETYTDLELHIAPREKGRYAVTAELDAEDKYRGALEMDAERRDSLSAISDPQAYGLALFDAVFTGNIYAAFTTARERACTQTTGRLRLRLWIDHEAADLHALVWERLHYRSEGGSFRVATDAKWPFSRYFGLQSGASSAVEGQVRMLCVIANPEDLAEYDLPSLIIGDEIANLRAALDGLRQSGVSITIMPGRTALSIDQERALKATGYTLLPGNATLGHIQQKLLDAPGYHIVHFLGHGAFNRNTEQAALMLEDRQGFVHIVTDDDLQARLAGLECKPHLMFLAACESAKRASAGRPTEVANPFVGLASRLVQIGVPAVIAMQEKIGITSAQTLTRYFYHYLLQHGIVDKAMNQARGFLVDTPDWSTPVLFMRLREGRLLERSALPPVADPPQLPDNPVVRRNTVRTAKQAPFPPNPFTDMLMIRDVARFVGREAELRRVRSLLQSGSVTLVGEPKIGKSSLMARLADIWRAENGGRVFGLLDCQGMLDCDDFFSELAKLIGLPATDDRRALRDALRITPGLLLIDEMDCAPEWGLTDNDFALFRAVCSANPGFKLVVVSRTSLKTLFPDARRGSPAYNFLLPYTLGELNAAEARAVLAHPWDPAAPTFDAATVDVLLALAGMHPFKLQRAAHHRYEALRDSKYDWQTAYRDEIAQIL